MAKGGCGINIDLEGCWSLGYDVWGIQKPNGDWCFVIDINSDYTNFSDVYFG